MAAATATKTAATKSASERLSAVHAELEIIASRYDDIQEAFDKAVQVGDDAEAEGLQLHFKRLEDSRKKAAAKIEPLQRAVEAEQKAANLKEGQRLAREADEMLESLRQLLNNSFFRIEQALDVVDCLSDHTALNWGMKAAQARKLGAEVDLVIPEIDRSLFDRLHTARIRLGNVTGELAQRQMMVRRGGL
ncbi:hypothetical protein [Nitrincola sp.]|uniref:hypothetical protein n=1 Tax=Nitrincola sp. TaxID=1926584 RepID=UPI003A94C53B